MAHSCVQTTNCTQGFEQWGKRVGAELHAAVQTEIDTLAASGPEGLPRGLTSAGTMLDHVKVLQPCWRQCYLAPCHSSFTAWL